jgi:hypothetical protein
VQLPAGIVRGGSHLSSDGTQWACKGCERRLFTGRLEPVALSHTGREGHSARNTLQKFGQRTQSTRPERVGWALGGEAGCSKRSCRERMHASQKNVARKSGIRTVNGTRADALEKPLCCGQNRREVAVGRGTLLVSSVGSAAVALRRGRSWSECERWGDRRRILSTRTVLDAKRQTQGKAPKLTATTSARFEDTVQYNSAAGARRRG